MRPWRLVGRSQEYCQTPDSSERVVEPRMPGLSRLRTPSRHWMLVLLGTLSWVRGSSALTLPTSATPLSAAPGPHCPKPLSCTLPAFACPCGRISTSNLFSRLLTGTRSSSSLPGGQFLPLTTLLHSISGWDGSLIGPHSGLLAVHSGSAELLSVMYSPRN